MNPHTQLIESLGCTWTGPWDFNPGSPRHYVLQLTTTAPPTVVIQNILTLAGWRIKKAPFEGHGNKTYLWAYPPPTT